MNVYDCGVAATSGSDCDCDGMCNELYGGSVGVGGIISATTQPDLLASCTETDDGIDPDTVGTIIEGGVTDYCLGDDLLIEYTCISDSAYTYHEVSCDAYYPKFAFACCSMGQCEMICAGAGGGGSGPGQGGQQK